MTYIHTYIRTHLYMGGEEEYITYPRPHLSNKFHAKSRPCKLNYLESIQLFELYFFFNPNRLYLFIQIFI